MKADYVLLTKESMTLGMASIVEMIFKVVLIRLIGRKLERLSGDGTLGVKATQA